MASFMSIFLVPAWHQHTQLSKSVLGNRDITSDLETLIFTSFSTTKSELVNARSDQCFRVPSISWSE